VVPPAACGITFRRDGQPFTVATSDDLAAQVDEIQYVSDQGPCLDAMYDQHTVRVSDMAHEQRWPRFRPGRRRSARPACWGSSCGSRATTLLR